MGSLGLVQPVPPGLLFPLRGLWGPSRILLTTGAGMINGFLLFPGECSVTGQAHFKSFDNKYFTFSGICQYLFAKDCVENSFSVIIETVQVTAALAGASAHALEREGRAVGLCRELQMHRPTEVISL